MYIYIYIYIVVIAVVYANVGCRASIAKPELPPVIHPRRTVGWHFPNCRHELQINPVAPVFFSFYFFFSSSFSSLLSHDRLAKKRQVAEH